MFDRKITRFWYLFYNQVTKKIFFKVFNVFAIFFLWFFLQFINKNKRKLHAIVLANLHKSAKTIWEIKK